jgi:cytochrome c oxidase subunit 2
MTKRMLRTLSGLGALAVGLGFAAVAWAAPQGESGLGLPRDVSAEGHRIDWLITVTNWLTGGLFVFMASWLLISALKHNTKNHVAKYDHGDSRASMYKVLGMASAVFFVVDGNLFVNSTTDLETTFHAFAEIEKNPETVRVEINAHQWAWDTRQAGPDGKFNTKDDIVLLNDLKVPVDTPIIFEVSSTDVLHAFNLPNFRSKVDAVPGQVNRMWVKAKQTGEFEIGCAQHCGANHYKMRGIITVLSKEDYAKWAAESSAIGVRAWDEADTNSHWGWDWKAE